MKKLIIVGAGGHSKTCIEVAESSKKYKVIGLIDNKVNINGIFKNIKIFNEKSINAVIKVTKNAHIGVGQIKSAKLRIKLFKKFKNKGFNFPVLIHSKAYISKYSFVGEGTLVGINSIINANCNIGHNTIINNKSLIEHDSIIGNNCHISTGVIINGNCLIGDNTFIGSGAIINNNISIGKNCVIGSGNIIKKDLKAGTFIS